ncbi:MAG: HD domain-containing protein [Pseudomonadales bacterium]|nr:HD domain-containing protein [Pseudomonadales bacterium]
MLFRQSDCLAVALGKRDKYTEVHCDRVEMLCLQLGVRCNLSASQLVRLRIAARLHDVGKIGIPDHILFKQGRLTPDELVVMRTHSVLGQDICNALPYKDAARVSRIIRHHHESFNGSGYPDGLSGDQIPFCSRIISLADSYDAMLTTRPYQRARSHCEVMDVMRQECGKKSDPSLFALFEQLVDASYSRLGIRARKGMLPAGISGITTRRRLPNDSSLS